MTELLTGALYFIPREVAWLWRSLRPRLRASPSQMHSSQIARERSREPGAWGTRVVPTACWQQLVFLFFFFFGFSSSSSRWGTGEVGISYFLLSPLILIP